jgi:mono/diheme cytochrome c family protein
MIRATLPALLFAAACGINTTTVDPMERQPKGKAYADNPFFEDGRAMRQPPAGTVPREKLVGNPAVAEGKVNGQDVTEIPIAVTPELLRVGHKQFDIVCATCHGLLGDGRSLVAANMSLRPPPDLHELREMTVGHYFQVITQGYGLMPGYVPQLSVEERWAVIAYLRALQLSQNAPLALAPPDERARLQREQPR